MNKQFYKDEIAACIRNVISDQEDIDKIIEELERRPEAVVKYFEKEKESNYKKEGGNHGKINDVT